MRGFYKDTAIFICIIAMVKSERWYSATVIDKRDADNRRRDADRDNNIINYVYLYGDNRFTPLLKMRPNLTNSENSKSTKFDNTFKLNGKSLPFTESDAIIKHYNDTIDNVDILTTSYPRRKIYRRCPVFRTKKTKKLDSKQLPKTKFLEVFQVVEFDHVSCTSSSGLEGTCLPGHECVNSGGSTMGTCADGYGTCCVTQFRCDGRSDASAGWLTNPDFPLPTTNTFSCVFTLHKSSEDVTQIRLDFNTFELLPPTDGVCQYDQFIVSGQNINSIIPILCGINSGQHFYVEVGDTDGPIKLTFQTASSESRLFSIQVRQLISGDELAAPSGCLQYYKEPQGYIESFNYRDNSEILIARIPSYFNNLNYAICIERAPGTCSVTYTNVGIMQILNYDIDGLPVIPPDQAGVEILNCPSDWLLIAATRLCGDRLNDGSIFEDFSQNAPVTDDSAGPIVVWFRSDQFYVGSGFKLLYQQNSCNS